MMTYRTLGIACAAAFLVFAATPADAKVCSSKTFIGGGSGTQVEATQAAIQGWISKVNAALGGAWVNLSIAEGPGLKCAEKDPSIKFFSCSVTARPCKPGTGLTTGTGTHPKFKK